MANDLLERLRNRIDVYAKKENSTEFGELTYGYEKVGTVWAEILPTTTGTKEESMPGNSIKSNITHKITVRNKAIKDPRNDMYFKFRNQRYDVMYFMPHYRTNTLIEFYCKLVIEREEDYDVK